MEKDELAMKIDRFMIKIDALKIRHPWKKITAR
jgi:hypothetical protein